MNAVAGSGCFCHLTGERTCPRDERSTQRAHGRGSQASPPAPPRSSPASRYPRNYRLFELRKLFSVRGETGQPDGLEIGISAIAVGSGVGFRLIATALTNASFIFRFEVPTLGTVYTRLSEVYSAGRGQNGCDVHDAVAQVMSCVSDVPGAERTVVAQGARAGGVCDVSGSFFQGTLLSASAIRELGCCRCFSAPHSTRLWS